MKIEWKYSSVLTLSIYQRLFGWLTFAPHNSLHTTRAIYLETFAPQFANWRNLRHIRPNHLSTNTIKASETFCKANNIVELINRIPHILEVFNSILPIKWLISSFNCLFGFKLRPEQNSTRHSENVYFKYRLVQVCSQRKTCRYKVINSTSDRGGLFIWLDLSMIF